MRRWIDPVLEVGRVSSGLRGYLRYARQWRAYARMPGAERLRLKDAYPCLHDCTPTTPLDPHYFYQEAWAMQAVARAGPRSHVDVGSRVAFVGMLTAVTRVVFIDIRPLEAELEGLECRAGSILALPFEDASVESLSCLHVAEHVGLGRYGDPLDPEGTRKAAGELSRVLAVGGHLYFSVPVGRPRVCFNAHRIHAPAQILEYFGGLRLVEFSGVNDRGKFLERIDPEELAGCRYGCGFFHFIRERQE